MKKYWFFIINNNEIIIKKLNDEYENKKNYERYLYELWII